MRRFMIATDLDASLHMTYLVVYGRIPHGIVDANVIQGISNAMNINDNFAADSCEFSCSTSDDLFVGFFRRSSQDGNDTQTKVVQTVALLRGKLA